MLARTAFAPLKVDVQIQVSTAGTCTCLKMLKVNEGQKISENPEGSWTLAPARNRKVRRTSVSKRDGYSSLHLRQLHSLNFTSLDQRDLSKVLFQFWETFSHTRVGQYRKAKASVRASPRSLTNCHFHTTERKEGDVEDSGGGPRWRRGSCLCLGLSSLTHFPTFSTSRGSPTAISSPTFSVKINGVNPDLLANWM